MSGTKFKTANWRSAAALTGVAAVVAFSATAQSVNPWSRQAPAVVQTSAPTAAQTQPRYVTDTAAVLPAAPIPQVKPDPYAPANLDQMLSAATPVAPVQMRASQQFGTQQGQGSYPYGAALVQGYGVATSAPGYGAGPLAPGFGAPSGYPPVNGFGGFPGYGSGNFPGYGAGAGMPYAPSGYGYPNTGYPNTYGGNAPWGNFPGFGLPNTGFSPFGFW